MYKIETTVNLGKNSATRSFVFFLLNRPDKFRNSFHKGRLGVCQMIREVSSKSRFTINKIVNLCKVQFKMSLKINYHGP